MSGLDPTGSSGQSGTRLPALDGVRGLAILLVLVFHFFLITSGISDHAADRWLTRVTGVGWIGVDLFFVLSGFLITGILVDAKGGASPFFRTFYARRFLRIFPVYYVFLAAVLFVIPALSLNDRAPTEALRDAQFWYWSYLSTFHIAMEGGLLGLTEFGHLWSLAIEEQFYLVWPLLILLLPRRAMLTLSAACIAGAFALRVALWASDVEPYIIYTLTPARVDALACGSLIALIARREGGIASMSRYAPIVAITCVAFMIGLFLHDRTLSPFEADVYTCGFSVIAVGFGALLVSVLAADAPSKITSVFSNAPLRALGRYSYALYVVHWPAALMLQRHADIEEWVGAVGGAHFPARLLFFVTAFAISFGVAFASWHILEQPILRLKDRFPYDQRPAVEAQPAVGAG